MGGPKRAWRQSETRRPATSTRFMGWQAHGSHPPFAPRLKRWSSAPIFVLPCLICTASPDAAWSDPPARQSFADRLPMHSLWAWPASGGASTRPSQGSPTPRVLVTCPTMERSGLPIQAGTAFMADGNFWLYFSFLARLDRSQNCHPHATGPSARRAGRPPAGVW